jgi:hypothetical protein
VALPRSPEVLLGAAYWRGAFLPVVHTTALLGRAGRGEPRMLLMLKQGGRGMALAADRIVGGAEAVEPPLASGPHPACGELTLGDAAGAETATWLDAGRLLDLAGQALAKNGGDPGSP